MSRDVDIFFVSLPLPHRKGELGEFNLQRVVTPPFFCSFPKMVGGRGWGTTG